METICFTTTAQVRRPQSKIIHLNEYRHCLETEKNTQFSSCLRQKPKSLRRRLELICLLLEASVCVSLLILTLTATVLFLAS